MTKQTTTTTSASTQDQAALTDKAFAGVHASYRGTKAPESNGVYALTDGRFSRFLDGQWRVPSAQFEKAANETRLDAFSSPQFRIKDHHRWSLVDLVKAQDEANDKAWLNGNAPYRLDSIRGGRETPYSGKILQNEIEVGSWFVNSDRERGGANGMFVKPEFREEFAKWAKEKLNLSGALKLCGCDESHLSDPLTVAFLAGQTVSSKLITQIKQDLKTARMAEKSAAAS